MNIIRHFLIKELLQFKRDKRMFLVVMIAPIVQLTLLGYAANVDVTNIKVVINDQDRSFQSRSYINRIRESGYFEVTDYITDYNNSDDYLFEGNISAVIIIPNDFEKNLINRFPIDVQVLFEGSDANKSTIALGYLQGITNKFYQNILNENIIKRGLFTISGNVIPQTRVWYNPEMKTRNFMVPGIMSLILLITTVTLMSMAIVKEKEIGTLEQLIVTPIKPYQLILGKLIPFIFIGMIVTAFVMSVMTFWFEIPIRGSILLLLLTTLIFILSNLGIGLFVSTIAKTQQQAMMISAFGIIMPMIYISGFAFPLENMPDIFDKIAYFIPLRYYIIILRGIVLKGIGIQELWLEIIVLLIMGIIILGLSILRFNKKIE